MRRLPVAALAAFLVAATTAATAAAVAPVLPGHPLLVDRAGLRVYGPANPARTPCPHLLPLPAHAPATVKRAVELAMPPFEKRVGLDGRDPIVTVGPTSKSGFSYVAGGCGRTAWNRSIFANVLLPHVTNSASLSQHRFAVGRVRQGWVIWGYIH
ncbi:MAG: hypothetical protein ACRDNM_00750 [Gaiellaceae bacterium]